MIDEIKKWKKKKAVILAHYYVNPEVQQIADYIGDSFYLMQSSGWIKRADHCVLRGGVYGRKCEDT